MSTEITLSIIKPDAVAKNLIGAIYNRFEQANFKIVAAQMIHLSKEQAEDFYDIHRERPFFSDLVSFMTSGPVMIQALEGENAIKRHRDIMGATNPEEALTGTLRADFANSLSENATHGSDSLENAKREVDFFFPNGVTPRTR